ncbi:MAG: acetylornithine transaminase [Actinomycetales bacterium]
MSELTRTADALPAGVGGSTPWLERYAGSVMATYGIPQRVLVRGEGCWVWDADGRRYLDLLGGIATTALGHAHPLLVSTVTAQLATLGHVSNFFATAPQVALAERLIEIAGAEAGSAVFFCNSGAEANEAAFKMSRRTGRVRIVAAQDAFHGRTMGALALTHKAAYREPFGPLPGDVTHVPYGDVEALRRAVDDSVAAVFLEPIQGEAGVRPAPDGYLAAAREVTERYGALLVIDEVQTGIGRTGAWFAHTRHGVRADVVTVAKSLGGGLPIGAAVALNRRAATLLGAGQHGTTYGGNPVSCAAGLAVLHAIERDDLLGNARRVGSRLRDGIAARAHPLVADVRGEGLLIAVGLTRPVAAEATRAALEQGFIVNAVAPDALRLAPALVVTPEQADSFVTALPDILDTAVGPAHPPTAATAAPTDRKGS